MELSPKDEILFVHKLTLEHKTNQNFSNSIFETAGFVISIDGDSTFPSSFLSFSKTEQFTLCYICL